RNNTLIIFTSDNGHSSFHLERYHAGLRGLKGFMYEGGVRVPCFMQLPGKGNQKEVTLPASYVDILPTILDVCDIPVPNGYTIDGKSLKPLMEQDDPDSVNHRRHKGSYTIIIERLSV
ncbi:MAG: sulfatase-like hydrolase/transferase, partial [Prolixibacteraceae bacterium]